MDPALQDEESSPEAVKGTDAAQRHPSRRFDREGVGKRFKVYSWAWSLMPMTTLGLSTLLIAQRSVYDFHGLFTIAVVVYLVGLVQWVLLSIAKIARFTLVRGSLQASLNDPAEAMFFAAFWISCYGILSGGADLAEPQPGSRLSTAFNAFFWIYLICALCACTSLHLLLFHERHLDSRNMTPAWLLPVLPVILVGVLAGSLADSLHPQDRYSVIVAGFICASLGFLLSLPIDAIYLHRLFVAGFPDTDQRPGMMIAVGPPSYAPLAFLKLSSALPHGYGYFAQRPSAIDIIQTMSFVMSMAMFGLGVFFFLMAVCAVSRRPWRMVFRLTWYGLIFPNIGFFSTMGLLGGLLPSTGVKGVASAGTVILSGLWLVVTAAHARASWKRSE